MTPQEAVDFIEKSAMLRILGPIGDEAWQTLKTAVLAQQTNNKQSTPCIHPHFARCKTPDGRDGCAYCGKVI